MSREPHSQVVIVFQKKGSKEFNLFVLFSMVLLLSLLVHRFSKSVTLFNLALNIEIIHQVVGDHFTCF